jgi:hypothetical protein
MVARSQLSIAIPLSRPIARRKANPEAREVVPGELTRAHQPPLAVDHHRIRRREKTTTGGREGIGANDDEVQRAVEEAEELHQHGDPDGGDDEPVMLPFPPSTTIRIML